MPRTVTIVITDDLDMTIKRFTAQTLDIIHGKENTRGNKGWEDNRSYAVEIVNQLFHANPDVFDHQNKVDAVMAEARKP